MSFTASVPELRFRLQFFQRNSRNNFLFLTIFVCFFCCSIPSRNYSQNSTNEFTNNSKSIILNFEKDLNRNSKKQQGLIKRFAGFGSIDTNDSYLIALCADVPDNRRPSKPFYKGACGHVFLTLSKISSANDTISTSFGFYPLHPDFSVFPFWVKSKIGNNSEREYDVKIEKKVNPLEFVVLLETAVRLCAGKYNLKKYNCYDYGLEVFNTVMKEKLPTHHIRLPLWIGKGGSPCSLYQDLEKMLQSGRTNEAIISFGSFKSPKSE